MRVCGGVRMCEDGCATVMMISCGAARASGFEGLLMRHTCMRVVSAGCDLRRQRLGKPAFMPNSGTSTECMHDKPPVHFLPQGFMATVVVRHSEPSCRRMAQHA